MSGKKPGRRSRNSGGFTLIELMVVISIIAVLAAVVGVNVIPRLEDGNVVAAEAQIKQFDAALVAYKVKFKKLPEELDGLVNPPSGDRILASKSIPLDPWDNPYHYEIEGARAYVITSLGADGAAGSDDVDADIRSDDIGGS